jgi:hypothetical protein
LDGGVAGRRVAFGLPGASFKPMWKAAKPGITTWLSAMPISRPS